MKKLNKKGFTIVELVIVIAVIGILAAVLIPTFSGIVEKANKSKATQEVKAAYTVYLASILSDDKTDNDKELTGKTIYVHYDNKYYVTVKDGEAKVVDSAPADATEYTIKTDTNGDKTLEKKDTST